MNLVGNNTQLLHSYTGLPVLGHSGFLSQKSSDSALKASTLVSVELFTRLLQPQRTIMKSWQRSKSVSRKTLKVWWQFILYLQQRDFASAHHFTTKFWLSHIINNIKIWMWHEAVSLPLLVIHWLHSVSEEPCWLIDPSGLFGSLLNDWKTDWFLHFELGEPNTLLHGDGGGTTWGAPSAATAFHTLKHMQVFNICSNFHSFLQ